VLDRPNGVRVADLVLEALRLCKRTLRPGCGFGSSHCSDSHHQSQQRDQVERFDEVCFRPMCWQARCDDAANSGSADDK